MYLKFNSRKNYVTLFENLKHLTTKFKKNGDKKCRVKKERKKKTRFIYKFINVSLQSFSNVITKSHMITSDLSFLTLFLYSKSKLFSLKKIKSSYISDQKLIIINRSNASDKQFKLTVINHENVSLSAQIRSITTDMKILIKNKLKQAIERCKKFYWRKIFIVNNDERSKIVLLNEINRFFFFFRWLSTTLMLYSFYISLIILKIDVIQ